MTREREMQVATALNKAIWLRDKVETLTKDEVLFHIKELSTYNMFSSRQLSAIANGVVHHATISKLTGKTNKTGGNLNVGTLDILRSILLNRADDGTDWGLIREAVGLGTSQGIISKFTGVPQGSISRELRS